MAEADWKRIAERLFNRFFGGRCLFKARYMPYASIDGTHFGVWTIDGYRPDKGRTFYSIAVDSEWKLGECYKNHVENFCAGLYFDGEGRRTPKLEWSSDEELLLKLSALGMAEVNKGDGDHI